MILLQLPLHAQQTMILKPDGSLKSFSRTQLSKDVKPTDKYKIPGMRKNISELHKNNFNSIYLVDTLIYPGNWDVNFTIFGQDWLLQWFKAPADLRLKKVGFACYENPDSMMAEVKVVKLNWNEQDLINAESLPRGYYEAIGNGYNNITAFLDNPDRTGDWASLQPGNTEPFGEDIWSDGGIGFQILPAPTDNPLIHQWVDLTDTIETQILGGEIFGIAVKNLGQNLDQNKVGFWANNGGFPGWKFYANGRQQPGVDVGWWSREYTFDFAAVVNFQNI